MVTHSEKVPDLYKLSSKFLKDIIENGSSLKDLVYNQSKFRNFKALYALLLKTVQHSSEINHMIDKSKLLKREPQFNPWLARVLITQLFWSNKGLEGTCKPITTILSYRAALEKHKLDAGVERTVSKVIKPRYVRVNTLAISLDETIDGFCNEGWELVEFKGKTYNDFISCVAALDNYQFMIDAHVDNLLIFSPKTQFYDHKAYMLKSIMLQDKASCLSVQLLNPPPGSTVLDCCAAPGMKTTFLAAWLNNEGTVYAIESNPKRYETLNTVIDGTYASCITPINSDVLLVTPERCPNVEYILVDPSCSGSGITDRVAPNDQPENADKYRLKKLSNIQAMILKHSLRDFPQAKRVVYSTCSVHVEENENVVDEVLKCNMNFKLVPADTLLKFPFNKPKLVGDHLDYIRSCCIRTTPEEDLTNGFFIAVFERVESGTEHDNDKNVGGDKSKKKKKKSKESHENTNEDEAPDSESTKRKKKKKLINTTDDIQEVAPDDENSKTIKKHKEKKKKSSSKDGSVETETTSSKSPVADETEKRKKKRRSSVTQEDELFLTDIMNTEDKEMEVVVTHKKKKKRHDKSKKETIS